MGIRSFDPYQVGSLECRAWVAYYQRKWSELLTVSVRSVRAGFNMPWSRTLYGAWLLLRAIQLWAPKPVNDPAGARRHMERFYRLLVNETGLDLDTAEAARLEIEWWRVHRERQHGRASLDELIEALTESYAHLYSMEPDDVRPAATLRAHAMDISDRWVEDGCVPDSPLITQELDVLVRSYAVLLPVVSSQLAAANPYSRPRDGRWRARRA